MGKVGDKIKEIIYLLGGSKPKKLDIKRLPSLGLFYPNDFAIKIKKASYSDIEEYENNFNKNILSVISKIRKVLDKNIILPPGYNLNSVMSIDIMYIFFEIVKYTLNKKIVVNINGMDIDFTDNFDYFEIPSKYSDKYDEINKEFSVNGYKYSLPTIGVEKSLTDFLMHEEFEGSNIDYNLVNFNFMYFVNGKNELSYDEVNNLITIFNEDMEDEDKDFVNDLVADFDEFLKYKIIYHNISIPVDKNIDLEQIWN